jgi:hypothetical protein
MLQAAAAATTYRHTLPSALQHRGWSPRESATLQQQLIPIAPPLPQLVMTVCSNHKLLVNKMQHHMHNCSQAMPVLRSAANATCLARQPLGVHSP